MSLLDTAELFLYVHGLHLLETRRILCRVRLSIIGGGRFLPARNLFLRYWHASNAIINVVPLASKALEVVRGVVGGDDGRITSLGLRPLLLPAGIEQLN